MCAPSTTEELIAVLERECELRRQQVRLAKTGSVALVAVILMLTLINWLVRGGDPLQFLGDLSPFFLVALGGVALTGTHRRALLEVQPGDARTTGFLIEALEYKDKAVIEHAERVLATSLKTMPALSASHSSTLGRRLVSSRNQRFVEAALRALGRAGGAESLAGVDFLAGGRGRFSALAHEAAADIRLRAARGMIEGRTEIPDSALGRDLRA